ncbi:MAG: cupin domain-containing protein [Bacilli bacterium]|nr:cupin domain-containing protein [Bacilli bacterium]MBN2696187.1 cupin domain-containing protein [Bacilli bacterium]
MRNVWRNNEVQLEQLDQHVSRKVLAHMKNLMAVEVIYDIGGIGAEHAHPHEQVTYVIAGKFRFRVGADYHDITKGDSIYFPPDIIHGCICLEAGRLLDVFTPQREDFIKEDN